VALTRLLGFPPDSTEAADAHAVVLADPGTIELVDRLQDWESTGISGHNQAGFAPNLVCLLADMGVGAGDCPRLESLLDAMLRHQEPTGAFASLGRMPNAEQLVWGSLPCDTLGILDALLRFGRSHDPHTRAALDHVAAALAETPQGPGWMCIPHTANGWHGPGRKKDLCPQVTLEALRVFAQLPPADRVPRLLGTARTLLHVWRNRGTEKPYFFGHGRQFKTVKWPPFWYDVSAVLDTLGRYPELWRGPNAAAEDRVSLAELGACLVAYDFGPEGRVTPRSCYKGFEGFSFGQKRRPSPFATAHLCAVLRRFEDLADEIAAVDVTLLTSSKGGSGMALPPR
jgi:hypothetical protein